MLIIYTAFVYPKSLLLAFIILLPSIILILQLGLISDGRLEYDLFVLPIMFLLITSTYGGSFYKYMPTYLGGIDNKPITIYLKEDAPLKGKNNKIQKNITGMYLFEDNNFFYIKKENNSIGIIKSNITAIRREIK